MARMRASLRTFALYVPKALVKQLVEQDDAPVIGGDRRDLTVLFMDLDAFKAVNDSYGHEIGSQLLIKLSRRLEQGLRRSDCVARIGGDEFAVVLEDVSDGNSALDTANKLITLIEETTRVGEAQVSVSASVGVALFPQDGERTQVFEFGIGTFF